MYKTFTWHLLVFRIEGGTGSILGVILELIHTCTVMIVLKEKKIFSSSWLSYTLLNYLLTDWPAIALTPSLPVVSETSCSRQIPPT